MYCIENFLIGVVLVGLPSLVDFRNFKVLMNSLVFLYIKVTSNELAF